MHGSLAQPYFLKIPSEPIRTINVQDSLELALYIQKWKIDQWKSGYPFANQDGILSDTLFLYKGSKSRITLDSIHYGNGESSSVNVKKPWEGIETNLQYWTSNGYPFTSLNLRLNNGVNSIYIDRGPFISYDTVIYNRDLLSREALERTIEMEIGKPYSEEKFLQLRNKIDRLSFLRLNSDPSVYFENNLAIIELDLAKTQSNSFEGIVGLLPRQAANDEVLVTGFLDFQLVNLFKSAKSLSMTWNRFDDQSQALELSYFHPFLAGTPMLFHFDFSLLKQDTTFLNQATALGIGIYLGKGKLFFEYSRRNGSIIDDMKPAGVTIYPSTIDGYSISYQLASVNRPFAYRDKFDFSASFSLGKKSVDVNFSSQDFDVEPKSNLMSFDFKVRNQFRLLNRIKLHNALIFGSIQMDQIFQNEKYRVGGLNTLRGFNENFFFVDSFVLSRVEFRQYFQSRSYFYLFQDVMIGYIDQQTIIPFGFGLGFSLQTKTGLLNFALAQGKEQNIPINPSESKVHIGFTTNF